MESWFHNIWFRRLWPIVLIGLLWFGSSYYDKQQARREVQLEDEIALTTAQLWVSSALLRHQPERYMAYRDSLLEAQQLTERKLDQFLERYRGEDTDLSAFSEKVKRLVDSLVKEVDPSRRMMIDSMIYDDTVSRR